MPDIRVVVGGFFIIQTVLHHLEGQFLLLLMTCRIVAWGVCLETCQSPAVRRRHR